MPEELVMTGFTYIRCIYVSCAHPTCIHPMVTFNTVVKIRSQDVTLICAVIMLLTRPV